MNIEAPATPSPRLRLLRALDQLSQARNVMDIGINALLAEAGVAKASLYSHFGSKEDLVVAWLDERQTRWFGWFEAYIREHAPAGPEASIDAAFGFLESWLDRDDFSGCPFLSVQLQLKGATHPASLQARRYANRLRQFFGDHLAMLRVYEPDALATALLELYLGAVVVQQLGTSQHVARTARQTAGALVRASLVTD